MSVTSVHAIARPSWPAQAEKIADSNNDLATEQLLAEDINTSDDLMSVQQVTQVIEIEHKQPLPRFPPEDEIVARIRCRLRF